jgi:hypothetical protein
MIYHRTVTYLLTVCLTHRDKLSRPFLALLRLTKCSGSPCAPDISRHSADERFRARAQPKYRKTFIDTLICESAVGRTPAHNDKRPSAPKTADGTTLWEEAWILDFTDNLLVHVF